MITLGQTFTIGTGSGTLTSGIAFQNNAYAHTGHIIFASELTAAGMTAGYITSIALQVSSSKNVTFTNTYIRLNQGSQSVFSTSGFSTAMGSWKTVWSGDLVFSSGQTGWKTIYFSTAYYWDGVSNLGVDICRSGWPYVSTPVTLMGTTQSTNLAAWTTNGGCGSTPYNPFNVRTNYQFTQSKVYDGSTWIGGSPSTGDHVVFSGTGGIFSDLDLASLTVEDNVICDILPGVKVSTTGALEVKSGASLNIWGDNTGYGQLKVDGSITNNGTIKMEQYLGSVGHHGISSPMTAGFTTTDGTSGSLYSYNASTGAWNTTPTVSSPGVGFFAPVGSGGFLSSVGTFSVTGTPLTSHTHNLGYSSNVAAGGSGAGWNLIGNPYTCGLDWASNTITKTNVNNAIYIWDPGSSTYKYYVDGTTNPFAGNTNYGYAGSQLASGIIAPLQAFWVQTTSSGQTIQSTMSNDGTVSSTPTFYKTTPDNIILVAINQNDNTKSDATWIKNVYGTTHDFEGQEDAWKRHNYGGQPDLYTYHNGEKIAINAIDLTGGTSIPVGFWAPNEGVKYRIEAQQVVNASDYILTLEDKHLNTFTPLNQASYTFNYGGWQYEDPRFVLHVGQSMVGIGEGEALPEVKLYQSHNDLVIQGDSQKHSHYKVIASDGRVITEGSLQAGMARTQAPAPGMYMVQLEGQQVHVGRVIVQ